MNSNSAAFKTPVSPTRGGYIVSPAYSLVVLEGLYGSRNIVRADESEMHCGNALDSCSGIAPITAIMNRGGIQVRASGNGARVR